MNKVKRMLSIFLSLLFIICSCIVPQSIVAENQVDNAIQHSSIKMADVPEAISLSDAEERGHIVRMYDEEERLDTVIFENNDNSKTLYLFDYPVKYVDKKGSIKDITLNIVENKEEKGSFITANNSIITKFSKNLEDGITLNDDSVSITMTPVIYAEKGVKSIASMKNSKTVTYPYCNNTNLEYSLTYTGFKEDIVVEKYTGQTDFEFILNTNGLFVSEIDGNYYLIDESEKVIANIGEVIIFTADEKNNAFGEMSCIEVTKGEEYLVTIHVDEAYLKDEKTVYPIRIDPSIEINYDTKGETGIDDVTIYSDATASGTAGSLIVGKRENYGTARVLMKFPGLYLNSGISASQIDSAFVEIRDLMCEDEDLTVECRRFNGNAWSESNATWSNVNADSYDGIVMSSNIISYDNGRLQNPYHRYSFNVVSFVRGLKTGGSNKNKGIMFKAPATFESGSTYNFKTFASYERATNKPTLVVTYSSASGPETVFDDFSHTGYGTGDTTAATHAVATGVNYINSLSASKFVSMSGVNINLKSDVSSNLVGAEWRIEKITEGSTSYYVIHSNAVSTRYLGAPKPQTGGGGEVMSVTPNSLGAYLNVSAYTVNNISAVPEYCKWYITSISGIKYYIKNVYYQNYYLCVYNNKVYVTSSATSANANSRTWRIVTKSSYTSAGGELTSFDVSPSIEAKAGLTYKFNFAVNPHTAFFATANDFNFTVSPSRAATVNPNNFKITIAGYTGDINIIVVHKPTGKTKSINIKARRSVCLIGENYFYGEDDQTHEHATYINEVLGYVNLISNDNEPIILQDKVNKSTALEYLDNTNIFVYRGHGGHIDNDIEKCTLIGFNDATLGSNEIDGMDFSKVELIVFCACETSYGGDGWNNLPTVAVANGAKCAIGFKSSVNCVLANNWIKIFFEKLSEGETVEDAANHAREGADILGALGTFVISGNKKLKF